MFRVFKGENRKLKDNLIFMVIEVSLIFLSVLLAFSMGRWQDKLDKKERVEVALQNIKNEIAMNRSQIEPLIKFHEETLQRVYEIPDTMLTGGRNSFELFRYALNDEDPRLPWVEKSAFEAAVFSGVLQEMDMELLTRISSLYNLQAKGIDSLFQQFSELISDPSTYDPDQAEEGIQAIVMILQSIYWNEKVYLERGEQLLEKIDEFQGEND